MLYLRDLDNSEVQQHQGKMVSGWAIEDQLPHSGKLFPADLIGVPPQNIEDSCIEGFSKPFLSSLCTVPERLIFAKSLLYIYICTERSDYRVAHWNVTIGTATINRR
ncbi:hypothetical protein M8J77_022581 [Diaphorina citri]|nr:hypothetical protein M8J77_022581 [Diaphorina citri]